MLKSLIRAKIGSDRSKGKVQVPVVMINPDRHVDVILQNPIIIPDWW
jgi:hypothetical protein